MANKNLLKKIAPVILSATVAMTGMPSAAFAAEFSDEEVLLDGSAEDEEADVEIADTEADVAEDEADTDITIADADENADDAETAEEELSDAEDVFGAEGETEAFAEDGNAVESGFVYGTANIPYADFFYGEMNEVQQNAEMQLDAADPVTAAGYREDGMYDAVTSCTNNKSKRYATSYYTENTENGSVTLEGIRDVNIAVPTSLYKEAQEAIKEGKNCSNQLLSIIGSLQKVSETAPESGEYKVLNGDGTLTAMKTKTKELKFNSSISTSSAWGDYEVIVEFGDENPDQPTTANMMGAIFETSDGEKYAMEHSQNLWLKTGKIAFAVKDGFVEPHGNTIDAKRSQGLEGKTIKKITYLVKDDMYPFYWTSSERGIFMRYTYEFKKKAVELYRQGKWIDAPNDIINLKNFHDMIVRWHHLEESNTSDCLKHYGTNKKWSPEEKYELVARVIAGDTITSVAYTVGINSGLLAQWIRKYKIWGYNGLVGRRKGRKPKESAMKKMNINNPRKLNESEYEELIRLRAEITYIKAENEAIKKEIALREEREAALLKAKKQQSSKNSKKKDIC